MFRRSKLFISIAAMFVTMVALSGCAGLSAFGEDLNRAWNGVSGTMTTYNQQGVQIDKIKGQSFRVSRDERFDTSNSDGTSKNDSSVMLISLGDNHISHVGSSMILAQDGLQDIMDESNARANFANTSPGMPWLNTLIEKNRNLWSGKAKTLMIRSQDGTPIAVFAGSNVEVFKTDVPKSTWFRVDGKMLFVYRTDYTITDTTLLQK